MITNEEISLLFQNINERTTFKKFVSACNNKELYNLHFADFVDHLKDDTIDFLKRIIAVVWGAKKSIVISQEEAECRICCDTKYTDGCQLVSMCGDLRHHICETCVNQLPDKKCPFCRIRGDKSPVLMTFTKSDNTVMKK